MKSRLEKILLLSIVLTLGLTRSVTPQDTRTGIVSGYVVDRRDRAPLNDASVVFVNVANGRSREARTTASGEYVLFQLEPGNYTLRAEREGYGTIQRRFVPVPVNQPKVVIPVFELVQIVAPPLQETRFGLRGVVRLASLGAEV
jgi:hypothetical protein